MLSLSTSTSRHTPGGYLRTRYCASEIDAIAAYAPDTDRCYLVPIEQVEERSQISLRVGPTRNNQARGIHWAKDYEMDRSLRRHWGIDEGQLYVPESEPEAR